MRSARRPSLPRFPRAVGVVAGAGSNGLGDVLAALQDRFPPVRIVTCTALVQGARAPLDVIDALARLDAHPLVDVIIIARGGGSVQDLVAFDDERLCRAVCACATPVIAAIGHTDNVPVCNHVAWAKETPSRSPELAVPSAAELRGELELAASRLAPLPTAVDRLRETVASVALDPDDALRTRAAEVQGAAGTLREAEHSFFSLRQAGLARAREVLAGMPGRVPDTAAVDALAGGLDAHAAAFFAAHAERIRTRVDLNAAAVADALDARRRNAIEQGERLTAGIRKELADHVRDYSRALERHVHAIRVAALRRLDAARRSLSDAAAGSGVPYERRLADARRELGHVAALLAASDPRRRGWVLPSDDTGAVVRSVRDLAVGQRLALSFHDGAAGAVVDTIPEQEQP